MANIADIDPFYIRAITALHSKDHLKGGKPILQTMLEESIKAKTGIEKNYTPVIQSLLKLTGVEDLKAVPIIPEEPKTNSSSENELELMDLMCVVCHGMDVGAKNRLLECTDCHNLYHQECHQPVVTQSDAEGTWVCIDCKTKRIKKSPTSSSSSHSSAKNSPSNTPRHSSSSSSHYKSTTSKSSSSKSTSSSASKSSSNSTKSSSNTNSSSRHSGVEPNVNIINADKRIQIMKKKAAKLHEKKKLPR